MTLFRSIDPASGAIVWEGAAATPAECEAAVARARAAGRTVELRVYPDTPHGFNADYRPSYRKAAAEDAWARMLAWFRGHGVG